MFYDVRDDRKIQIHENVLDLLANADLSNIKNIIPLIWTEHCLECGAPECYKTCKKYEADRYGRCKRTKYGEIFLENIELPFPATQLQFKSWGKLMAGVNGKYSYKPDEFKKYYMNQLMWNRILRKTDVISQMLHQKDLFARFRRHQTLKRFGNHEDTADFDELLFVFYAYTEGYQLILDLYGWNSQIARSSYQVKKGLNIWHVNKDILKTDIETLRKLELYPSDNNEAELIFLISDFVKNKKEKIKKIKCVVWDLDHTIWDGVVGDDGADGITLKNGIENIIHELDNRGILQSIASRNNYDLAWKALEKYKLAEYFLYPQINWVNKSENIRRIQNNLNIGIDTIAFIDDSQIEREEVKNAIPEVRVYSEDNVETILLQEEFCVEITEDTKKRRQYYRDEENRKDDYEKVAVAAGETYKKFVQSCQCVVELLMVNYGDDLQRCHELMERTNQLNAATIRRTLDELIEISKDNQNYMMFEVYCKDRYGEYGTVGCIIIEITGNKPVCTDFVLSCRVAGKKIENAIIFALLNCFKQSLVIHFNETNRNRIFLDTMIEAGGKYDNTKKTIEFQSDRIIEYDWVSVKINRSPAFDNYRRTWL